MKHQQQMALLEKAKILNKDRNRASKLTDKGVAFTRRLLAIIFALALVAPIFYSVLQPNATIYIPQESFDKSWWDLLWGKQGTSVTEYVEVKAPVLAMPVYELCSLIIGFYFGSGGNK